MPSMNAEIVAPTAPGEAPSARPSVGRLGRYRSVDIAPTAVIDPSSRISPADGGACAATGVPVRAGVAADAEADASGAAMAAGMVGFLSVAGFDSGGWRWQPHALTWGVRARPPLETLVDQSRMGHQARLSQVQHAVL